MRIDRIRIRSLASLHGLQPVIDLSGPDLGQAGLVAITGPTGSGKSTILDALCLALYGRTPRLERQAGELLARDAQDGSATVDLTLTDGSRWSAAWSLRRMRTGETARPAMQVVDAGGGVVAEGVQAVAAWSTRRLGLSFDQFRGVVLLPQFEFARFLSSDDAERSTLLEKLTGTGIYARLSQAAFLANQQASGAVQTHAATLAMLVPMNKVDRTRLDDQLAQAEVMTQEASKRVADARALVAWHAERIRLDQMLAEAVRRHDSAVAVRQGAAVEADLLILADAAEVHAAALAVLAQAEAELDRLLAAEPGVQAGAARSQSERHEVATRVALLEARVMAAIARAEQDAREVSVLAAVPLADLAPAQEAAAAVLAAVHQVRDLESAAVRTALQVQLATAALVAAQAARETAVTDERLLLASIAEQQAQLDALAGAGGVDALVERAARATAVRALGEAWATLDPALARRQAEMADAALAEQTGRCTDLHHQLAIADSQVDVARARRHFVLAQARAAELRPQLQEGEPCPLCGAIEHPWAQHAAPGGDALAACDQAVHAAAEEVLRVRTTCTEATTAATRLAGAAAAARAEATAVVARHDDLAQRYAQYADLPGLPALHDMQAIQAWSVQQDERLDQARQCAMAWQRLNALLQTAQQTSAAAAAALTVRVDAVAEARAAQDDLHARLSTLQAARTEAQDTARSAVAALAARLGEPRPEQASHWLSALPSRMEAARASVGRAHMQAEVGADLLVQARAIRGDAPLPAAVDVSAEAITELRTMLNTYGSTHERARRDAEALRQHQVTLTAARGMVVELGEALRRDLVGGPFASIAAVRAAQVEPARRAALRARLRQLDDDLVAAAAGREAAQLQRCMHAPLPGFEAVDQAAASAGLAADERALADLHQQHGHWRHAREQDEDLCARRAATVAAAGPLLERANQARSLYDLIGHKDGDVFRRFAQAMTLDQLLVLANHRLASLQPRYALARTPATIGSAVSLELDVVDHDQAGERRPVATLSGGETFLVSLALSLALADLQGGGLRLGTLFIDEGFGSLDPATLERCLAILERLQQDQGTQIVVISHVGALHERLAHRIEVQPWGHGRSRLRVVWPGGAYEYPRQPESDPPTKRRRIRRSTSA